MDCEPEGAVATFKRKNPFTVMIKKLLLILTLSLLQLVVFAQEKSQGLEDTLRSNGKIYVVVAVILIIFAGIILYLIRLDRKISKLEKNDS
jgi:CcmD family protein